MKTRDMSGIYIGIVWILMGLLCFIKVMGVDLWM